MQIDCKTILNQEYKARKDKNPNYSKSAFAKALGLSLSFTTYLMSGKKNFSEEVAINITEKLNFPKQKAELFLNLYRLENTKNDTQRQQLEEEIQLKIFQLNSYSEFEDAHCRLISNWYVGAIILILQRDEGRIDPIKVAKQLSITESEISTCLNDLQLHQVISKDDQRYLFKTKNLNVAGTPSSYIRKYHRGTLQVAIDKVQKDNVSERDYTGLTVWYDKNRIDEFRELVADFRSRVLLRFGEEQGDSIYQLNTQFYPLMHL